MRQNFFNSLSKFFFHPFAIFLVGFSVLVYMGGPIVKKIRQKQALEMEIQNLKQDITAFEGKNADLKKMLEYLKSDNFLEEQARVNFNMKKEGESVAVIQFQEENAVQSAPTILGIKEEKTNTQKWQEYFLKPKLR